MARTYSVELGRVVYGYYEVEAESKEEALKIAKTHYCDDMGIVDNEDIDEEDDFLYVDIY